MLWKKDEKKTIHIGITSHAFFSFFLCFADLCLELKAATLYLVRTPPADLVMKVFALISAIVAVAPAAYAQHKGVPFGFANTVTGGGSATPSYPTTNAQ